MLRTDNSKQLKFIDVSSSEGQSGEVHQVMKTAHEGQVLFVVFPALHGVAHGVDQLDLIVDVARGRAREVIDDRCESVGVARVRT